MTDINSTTTVTEQVALSVQLFYYGPNLKHFTFLPQNMQHFLSNVVQHSDRAEESSSTVSALQLYRPLKETEILQKEMKIKNVHTFPEFRKHESNVANTSILLTQEKQAAARKIPIRREKNPVATA